VLAQVARGDWKPPAPAPAVVEPVPEPTFHEFASEWLDGLSGELAAKTVEVYEWRLSNHLLRFFEHHRLSEITPREVDRYKRWQLDRGQLSAGSINKTITRLAQILDQAAEYGLVDGNAAKGKRRRLKADKPKPAWLDRAAQVEALARRRCGA
jgi:integrase-like protein